jgi:hypothetical protein
METQGSLFLVCQNAMTGRPQVIQCTGADGHIELIEVVPSSSSC